MWSHAFYHVEPALTENFFHFCCIDFHALWSTKACTWKCFCFISKYLMRSQSPNKRFHTHTHTYRRRRSKMQIRIIDFEATKRKENFSIQSRRRISIVNDIECVCVRAPLCGFKTQPRIDSLEISTVFKRKLVVINRFAYVMSYDWLIWWVENVK